MGRVVGRACRETPDWGYPILCDTTTGEIHRDDFNGRWGDKIHLDKFLQAYVAEKVKIESRQKSYVVAEG